MFHWNSNETYKANDLFPASLKDYLDRPYMDIFILPFHIRLEYLHHLSNSTDSFHNCVVVINHAGDIH